jgi:hypothetical protein
MPIRFFMPACLYAIIVSNIAARLRPNRFDDAPSGDYSPA